MGVLNQVVRNTLSFALVTFVLIALHYLNFSVWVPSIFHFFTFSPYSSYLALDQISVVNVVAFLFLSSLIFFGYFSPVATAYLTALFIYAIYSGTLSFPELSVFIPGFVALYSGLVLSDGISKDFNHKGIVYSQLRRGLAIFGISIILTILFVLFRFSIFQFISQYV